MVSKSGLDLQRRDRSGATGNLAPSYFFHVPAEPRQYRNSVPYLAAHGKCARSRRLNRPKSSLAWLILEAELEKWLPTNRLLVRGAKVQGPLNLSYATISSSLAFEKCSIGAGLRFQGSHFEAIEFSHTHVGPIHATFMLVDKLLSFDHTVISGLLQLANAKIGDFNMFQTQLGLGSIIALNAPNLQVDGNFALIASTLIGRIHIIGAQLSGDLNISSGEINAKSNIAIFADAINISGRCHIRAGTVVRVRMVAARIGGELDLSTTEIRRSGEFALDARNSRIGGTIFLTNGFLAEGRVAFYGADIGGAMILTRGEISPRDGSGLDLRFCKINGTLEFGGGFVVAGQMLLYGMTVQGDMDCSGASIFSGTQNAIDARRATIKGSVFLNDGFVAENEVNFFGTVISGDFVVRKADVNGARPALILSGIKTVNVRILDTTIDGGIELIGAALSGDLQIDKSLLKADQVPALNADNLRARTVFITSDKTKVLGTIRLYGSVLTGDVIIRECSLAAASQNAMLMNARSMHCSGTLHWKKLLEKPIGIVDLEQSHVGKLDDDIDDWPAELCLAHLRQCDLQVIDGQ